MFGETRLRGLEPPQPGLTHPGLDRTCLHVVLSVLRDDRGKLLLRRLVSRLCASHPSPKLASFALAGALAGLAGYLSAAQSGFVNPEILSWRESGNVLLMVILGGAGTTFGPLVGAFVLVLLEEWFSWLTQRWQLLLGAAIVMLVLFLPGGLGNLYARVRNLRAARG